MFKCDVTGATTLQPTITMSNERETNEPTPSSKDLPKASKDQKDLTRNLENPPLSGVKFDTFIYVLGLVVLLVAVYYTSQMLKLSDARLDALPSVTAVDIQTNPRSLNSSPQDSR